MSTECNSNRNSNSVKEGSVCALPEVRWYWGESGSGKTRAAHEWLGPDTYTCMDNIKWFQGYDRHECVLIDDFRRTLVCQGGVCVLGKEGVCLAGRGGSGVCQVQRACAKEEEGGGE
eukprot:365026-Chlamydomonas_euryale.AAC.1